MRKPVFPRVLLITLLYCCVFVLLVSVQFAKRGDFTQNVGNFIISGQNREPVESESAEEYLLEGDIHVVFGGMDFGLVMGDDRNSLYLVGTDGEREKALPDRMVVSENAVNFIFPEGTALVFTAQPGIQEIWISADFSGETAAIELPIRPLRRAGMRDAGDGKYMVTADRTNYSFENSTIDAERMILLINTAGRYISYGAVTERKGFSPYDFIIQEAATAEAYNEALSGWRDQSFSLWRRFVAEQNNEDLVIALAGEAVARDNYRDAVASIPNSFLNGNTRTYESSVFLGGLDVAYSSLLNRDREKLEYLTRQINENSLEFLFEPQVFGYFAIRGHRSLIHAALNLVNTITPATLALDIVSGILEGYVDWGNYRISNDNPFERLASEACLVISDHISRTDNIASSNPSASGSRVTVFSEGMGDTELNLRIGKAVLAYAEKTNNEPWAGIGRSLILSALFSTDDIVESSVYSAQIRARLYRILNPADAYPRAVNIVNLAENIWVWTTSPLVTASLQNATLDINVSFPNGETHFMIVRGIQPINRLQLYNIDYRTDPQFERYDSSGWSYIAQEQTLILKMRHRSPVERVRIFLRDQPRSAPMVAYNTTYTN